MGDLVKTKVSDTSLVISEPGEATKVAYDLKAMPDYLSQTSTYLTPYAWDEFTILILPTTMTSEVAGMENPYLTIVSQTTSQMVLHELSHAWFGNLVTCSSWPSFWLNEGFAVFVERKITEKMLGEAER